MCDWMTLLTAQHSTAQHSTAQHSTAQHSRLIVPFLRLLFADAARIDKRLSYRIGWLFYLKEKAISMVNEEG